MWRSSPLQASTQNQEGVTMADDRLVLLAMVMD